MENIESILEGIELTSDQRSKIIEGVKANYRTINEVDGKANRIEELEAEIKKRDDAISELQGDQSELKSLRDQIAEYKAADEKRKEQEAERDRLSKFEQQFDDAVSNTGHKFVNSYTRDAVLKDALDRCAKTEGLGVDKALEAIATDNPSIWKNPQHEVVNMPSDIGSAATDKEAAKRREASRIFGSSLGSDME